MTSFFKILSLYEEEFFAIIPKKYINSYIITYILNTLHKGRCNVSKSHRAVKRGGYLPPTCDFFEREKSYLFYPFSKEKYAMDNLDKKNIYMGNLDKKIFLLVIWAI